MNLLFYVALGGCFVAGWYSCNKKDEVKAWLKKVFKKGFNKVDDL